MKKVFCVEVYGKDDILVNEYQFDTKSQQLEKYYNLINKGYKKSDLIKRTMEDYN